MEQSVSLLEDPAISRHVRDRQRVGLREDHVEKAPATLRSTAYQRQVLRPEEHDRAHAEHGACGAGLAVDGGDAGHAPCRRVTLKPDGQRGVCRRPRHVSLGHRAVLVPEQQIGAARGARGARERKGRDRLQEVGLALCVLAMNDIEPGAEAHRGLRVVAEAVHAQPCDRATRRPRARRLGRGVDGGRVDAHASRPAIDAINSAMRRVASGRAADFTATRMVASASEPGAASSATASTSCSSRGT
jgi:hypothetical protein